MNYCKVFVNINLFYNFTNIVIMFPSACISSMYMYKFKNDMIQCVVYQYMKFQKMCTEVTIKLPEKLFRKILAHR